MMCSGKGLWDWLGMGTPCWVFGVVFCGVRRFLSGMRMFDVCFC